MEIIESKEFAAKEKLKIVQSERVASAGGRKKKGGLGGIPPALQILGEICSNFFERTPPMVETHPFGIFIPPNTQYLFLGTFTGKITDTSYDWFLTTKRNQFWQIMSQVYGVKLRNKEEKQKLFSKLKMAITDVILACERSQNTNADNNLINIVFNIQAINKVIKNNKIKKIFFSSRYAESLFRKNFKELIKQYPQIELVTLPSSSPRYAAMSKSEKITRYKKLLPLICEDQ